MMRVVVADDQALVREGIVAVLSLTPGIEVVGQAGDGAEAVRLVHQTTPDVVLMDLRMPRVDGVAATQQILQRHPTTRILVLTTYADDASIKRALAVPGHQVGSRLIGGLPPSALWHRSVL
ncbi:hypothetical protein CGZ93_05035 [Enemella dayhoffiae]|uniref:Response regulatory domain-containing protein n=1 Tax=Enemella dayhoffiae TaxID=2016507 RepID=A0A255H8J1_9ACTN|nr:hypothetical protein CGZ93_05035 [Enemella dayhoffiae]